MSDEVRIVEAEAGDAKQVLDLLKQLDQETETFTVEDDLDNLTVDTESQQLKIIQASRENLILLAKYQGQSIGLATVMKSDTDEFGEVGVAVLSDFWGQGLGTALMEETLTWGETFSWLSGLVLTVQARNVTAAHIYTKLGFKEIKRNKKGFRDKSGILFETIDMKLAFN
ncbi:Acetyltransferase [Pediococcus damnosus]|uniref:Acetyltransferase n=1 Tax=Pediococcus damnosus TaxID=51663 RepID=A0A0R2HUH4_9LACO|nr:GNAT family N-acetyltransferase [Pediococcus damnosus]AMV60002.1 Acetyltransferase [Pediococcus damnosus]AMV62541.1 Acetyltransferase [Pediococcus damnosus]AMV64246.1 Acetyltransferase [Pediococcus damnosus]AMV67583.1 Acetyltransferase [Pediococcus damnosus]AMV69073.1 Acetyltransferase [Pediococcus damnosus]